MIEERICAICKIKSTERRIDNCRGTFLCSKHRNQIYRYGKITDPTQELKSFKENEIIMHETYAELVMYDTKNIKYITKIDIEDVEKIKKKKWRYERCELPNKGYVVSGSHGKRIFLHRYVLGYTGSLQVDHINRDRLDNRKQNLRIVNQVINAQNIQTKKNNIICRNNKYYVYIQRFKHMFLFGSYDNVEEAICIREQFLEFVQKNEKALLDLYDKHTKKNPVINKRTMSTFEVNGKIKNTIMCKTIEEMIQTRDDMKIFRQ